MTNLSGPTDPSSPETAPGRAVEPRSLSGGSRAASDAPNGPQAGAQPAGGPEAPRKAADGKSPADTANSPQTGAQGPWRGQDAGQAGEGRSFEDLLADRLAQFPLPPGLTIFPARPPSSTPSAGPLPPASGWCPSCGRGDVAPTGEQLAQAQREAEQLQRRLDLAHQARRAKARQLDGIRHALIDVGAMAEDDPHSHADLEDVIRQAYGGDLVGPAGRTRIYDHQITQQPEEN